MTAMTAMTTLSALSGRLTIDIDVILICIPCAGVGLLAARRQPGNPIGWLFLAIVACMALSTCGGDYAALAYRLGHTTLPGARAGLVLGQVYIAGLPLFAVIILLRSLQGKPRPGRTQPSAACNCLSRRRLGLCARSRRWSWLVSGGPCRDVRGLHGPVHHRQQVGPHRV